MEINKGICPLCGRPNDCAAAAGRMHEGCWCEKTSVPKELREKIPKELKGKVCICKQCVMKFKEKNM